MRDDRPIWHNEFQYDKWDAFANGRTGEQQMAWERRERARKAAEVIQAMDDTTRAVSDEELDCPGTEDDAMTKLDVDQIHKIAYDEYMRVGHVTLSGELARELFTNIPNREKSLEEALAISRSSGRARTAERDKLRAYATALEGEVARLTRELVLADACEADVSADVLTEMRAEHGVADLMDADR